MTRPLRVLAVLGTRPEAIKMAPVIQRLANEPQVFETRVCVTAQHRELLDSILDTFDIRPDIDLDLMRPDQSLNSIAAGVFQRFDKVLNETEPAWLLVQGDTTTVLAASLAAFHRRVAVAHVEAGLRTGDLQRPFPEEMNRRVTDLVADLHFAPTARSAAALRAEGVAETKIHVTGNTVVDALLTIAAGEPKPASDEPLVLITAHRRESFGEPLRSAFRAIRRLALRFPNLRFVFPVHPNPNVRRELGLLDGPANIHLADPADYRQLVRWLRASRIVITDSGGIQEEAPTFGKPTLVLREATERPEGVEAGIALLVGTDEELIYQTAERLLTDEDAYRAIARTTNPYGDGLAAERIAGILAGREVTPFAPAAARP
jgi:UDP-N-acetylglucosamine 2-epimerase